MVSSFTKKLVVSEDRRKFSHFLNIKNLLADYYREKRAKNLEFRAVLADGRVRWLRLSVELVEYPNSTDIEAYLMYEDINDVKLSELRILEEAKTDPLTGLLNRKTFASALRHTIKTMPTDMLCAVFLMDIDFFKQINDSFGHSEGDKALVSMGKAICSAVDDSDYVCRLGGDEFLVCVTGATNIESVRKKAESICKAARKINNIASKLSVSLGIAVCPADGATFDELYHNADKALYYVKAHGKDGLAFFDSERK